MKTYKMKVARLPSNRHHEVEVQASSEEEAMQLAEEAVQNGGRTMGRGDRMEHAFEANENSIEERLGG